LNAEIELYCNAEFFGVLSQLADELRFVFITSNASVMPGMMLQPMRFKPRLKASELKVVVSEHTKCVRCWHQRPDVGGMQSILSFVDVAWKT